MTRSAGRSPPGASRAVRIDGSPALDSRHVATELAGVVGGSDLVLCGDFSLDRGTGSVPAFLAHELGVAQALGLLQVAAPAGDSTLRCLRRLDGGRREVLDVRPPAVISVEGSVARLRRASLGAVVGSKAAPVDVVKAVADEHATAAVVFAVPPAGPRAAASARRRARPGARHPRRRWQATRPTATSVVLEPAAAAQRIVDQLAAWGYLHEPGAATAAGTAG